MKIGDAKKKALDLLGKDAKLPKTPGDLAKEAAAVDKAVKDMLDLRSDFEARLLVVRKAVSSYRDTCETTRDVYEGSDFSLDPKQGSNKANIAKATQLLTDALDEALEEAQKLSTVCEGTFKQVASMAKTWDAL